ncbi:MAG: hypothetical protein HQK49_17305 [Oligoflexia bacterium]|nr:hypothetical protein [Oligoflexia bacterium]
MENISNSVGYVITGNLAPWKSVANWTHSLPTNATDAWMDQLLGYYHRWRSHHLITDGAKVALDRNLSFIDFMKHTGLDFITEQGLPIIPESATLKLASLTGLDICKITPWIHLNILDFACGGVATAFSVSDLIQAINGNLDWGLGTALRTFGGGTIEIAVGASTKNPLFIASGVIEIGAGVKSAYDFYSQPFLFGVPLINVLSGVGGGAISGALFSLVDIGLSWNKLSTKEMIYRIVKNSSVSAMLGGVSTISLPATISLGVMYALGQIIYREIQTSVEQEKYHFSCLPYNYFYGINRMIIENGLIKTANFLDEFNINKKTNFKDYLDKSSDTYKNYFLDNKGGRYE